MVADRGSDCHAAGHALGYSPPVQINCTLWWDNSHDAYRGVLEAVKARGLYPFVILIMVCINLDHGPDTCSMRYNQMLELARTTMPLFNHENFDFYDIMKIRRIMNDY